MAEMQPVQRRPCPRCGTSVEYTPPGPEARAGVAMCGNCGAEVPFGAGGDQGGRVSLADQSVPAEAGAPEGAPSTRCDNCGAEVPLRGASHAERTGIAAADGADTVTCPNCGVEVDISWPETEAS